MRTRPTTVPLVLFVALAAGPAARAGDFDVPVGQLTFDAEGREGGRYHSRRPHVPGNSSGLTIGRGYDMKWRKMEAIQADLEKAGVAKEAAALYAGAAGLAGDAARKYAREHDLAEITPAQQKALFAIAYAQIEADVRRICAQPAVVKEYGKVDWGGLKPRVRDVLVDLRYRGDYTPASRKKVQKLVVDNDEAGLAAVMADRANWPGVPEDRFRRRRDYLAR